MSMNFQSTDQHDLGEKNHHNFPVAQSDYRLRVSNKSPLEKHIYGNIYLGDKRVMLLYFYIITSYVSNLKQATLHLYNCFLSKKRTGFTC